MCGLMHDIGKPVLLQSIPVEYLPILNDVYRGQASFHESEMSSFGFSHAHVGALLAGKWNFPPHLAEAIGYHHDPLSAPSFSNLACVTSLANQIMIFLEIGFERNKNLRLDTLREFEILKLNRSVIDTIVEEAAGFLSQMTDSAEI